MGCEQSKVKYLEAENAKLKEQLKKASEGPGVKRVNFIHFNDCYELEPNSLHSKPCGGASRFSRALEDAKERLSDPMVVFSGDFVGPSLSSVVTQGAHIKEALDSLDVDVGVLGNHEWDYGAHNLDRQLHGYTTKDGLTVPPSRVKWVMSNATDKTGKPLGGASEYHTITRGGVKVGFIGIVENWIKKSVPSELGGKYQDFVKTGESLAKKLKGAPENCDLVVAVTHNRLKNDLQLSKGAPSIDLILGGHDHEPSWRLKDRLIKSGQNFEYLTMITVEISPDGTKRSTCEIDRIDPDDPTDPQMDKLIDKYAKYRDSKMKRELGKTSVELDSRESATRFGECLLGNLITDAVAMGLEKIMSHSGIKEPLATVIIPGACIKGQKVLAANSPVTMGDLFLWSPVMTTFEVIKISGEHLVKFIEESVKALSHDGTSECGSFPHCSGHCEYTLDVSAPAGSRVSGVKIRGDAVEARKMYAVAVTPFVTSGKAVDFINADTPVLLEDDDSIDVVKALKEYLAFLRGDDDAEDDDDGDVANATPVDVKLGRVNMKK